MNTEKACRNNRLSPADKQYFNAEEDVELEVDFLWTFSHPYVILFIQ